MKKWIVWLLALTLLAGLMTGCSKASAPMDNAAVDREYGYLADMDMGMEMATEAPSMSTTTGGTGLMEDKRPTTQENRKLIRTIYLEAQTQDMDALLSALDAEIYNLGGYVEARHVYDGGKTDTRSWRYAELTVRIPATDADRFVDKLEVDANITSTREETEDVTLTYVATESRVAALETEQTRLLELLSQAENMEDLLMIESRLTDVRTELERVASQLRLLDNQVDYATIHLKLNEVVEYTIAEPTVLERIVGGFKESLSGLGTGLLDFAVWLITASPYLAFYGVVIVLVIVLVRRGSKRRKAVKAAKAAQKPEEQEKQG